MIISRTPLRMSFTGGGTDIPAFYRRHGGAVVSTAIDRYVYITVNPKFDERVRVSYSRTEETSSAARVQHPLVREALQTTGITGGVEITSVADIPARGTGLGSSSTFTVGLLNALHAQAERHASAEQLAREACEIEIERCGEPIGKQDQYAAAYGGLNYLEFRQDGTVAVEPIICRRETLEGIQQQLLVFYTGITRSASKVLQRQSAALRSGRKAMNAMKRMAELARELRRGLQRNQPQVLAETVHENWELKRSLAKGISSSAIDAWHKKAMKAGASAGKLLGAGSGGFLMFLADPSRHEAIRRTLSDLREVPFQFEPRGSQIIFVHHPRR
ncbi:MAG: GHMP kinase [Verrucomicrobia bacterium]|nr:GHMP kinase [Verrucomicrobiota bacterium]